MNSKMSVMKKVVGTLAIPVLFALVLGILCAANGKPMIGNRISFNYFMLCYAICGALMGVVGFLNAARSTSINGGSLNFGSIAIMFTAFLPMFIGGYIGRFSNEKLGYLLAALCMSMLNSTFAAFSNEISASMQSIINAVLLVVFLIYLSNEHKLAPLLKPIRKK